MLCRRFIGEIIGQLSVALTKVDATTNQAKIFQTAKEWAIPTLIGKIELMKDFAKLYEKEFGGIYESLPQQIIHRDPNPGNIILSDNNWEMFLTAARIYSCALCVLASP